MGAGGWGTGAGGWGTGDEGIGPCFGLAIGLAIGLTSSLFSLDFEENFERVDSPPLEEFARFLSILSRIFYNSCEVRRFDRRPFSSCNLSIAIKPSMALTNLP